MYDVEDTLEHVLFSGRKPVVSQHLQLGDDRDRYRAIQHHIANKRILWLSGIDHDVGVEKHHVSSRPGSGLSLR